MLKVQFFCLFFLCSIGLFAQNTVNDTINSEIILDDESILNDTIMLEEVIVYKEKLDPESKKQFLLLQNRVYKTYPYAKVAAERLSALNRNMGKLNNNKDKKKYFKIVENYMENEFKAQLKKLSRKQGQILVKLIHRQTGLSTYDLIKDYKSGWKAFWSNNTARLFDINLKTKYAPYEVNEDFLIETILSRAFNNGRLIEQKPVTPIDIDDLTDFWQKKAQELNKTKSN